MTAEAPGSGIISILFLMHSLINIAPGSEIAGVPASDTIEIIFWFLMCLIISWETLSSLCSWKLLHLILMLIKFKWNRSFKILIFVCLAFCYH